MKVFVTGATGFVGTPTTELLLKAGYEVSAIARSDDSVAALSSKGIRAVKADLTSLDIIKAEAAKADAVVHLAYIHDFSKIHEALKTELSVVEAILDALEGSNKVFVGTAATGILGDVNGATEDSKVHESALSHRAASEKLFIEGAKRGVRSAVVRLPMFVYNNEGAFFTKILEAKGKALGGPIFIGSGTQEVSILALEDAATIYVQAVQHATAGAIYHAVFDQVSQKELAEALTTKLSLAARSITKEEAAEIFGGPFFVQAFSINNVVDSAKTRSELQWEPKHGGRKFLLDAVAGKFA